MRRPLPVNGNSSADLVRYIPPGLPLLKPSILPDVLRSVQDSLLRQRQLEVSYTGPGATIANQLLLHPLALIQQGERSYLLATTFDYEDRVYYALHRINSAGVIEEPAKRPASFSLNAFLAQGGGQFGDGKTITLKANLSDYLANILRETAISPDQNITTRGGKNTLTAIVTDSWQLHFWLLSQGPAITVLKSDELRKQIITALKSSLSHYEAITLGSNRSNPMWKAKRVFFEFASIGVHSRLNSAVFDWDSP